MQTQLEQHLELGQMWEQEGVRAEWRWAWSCSAASAGSLYLDESLGFSFFIREMGTM